LICRRHSIVVTKFIDFRCLRHDRRTAMSACPPRDTVGPHSSRSSPNSRARPILRRGRGGRQSVVWEAPLAIAVRSWPSRPRSPGAIAKRDRVSRSIRSPAPLSPYLPIVADSPNTAPPSTRGTSAIDEHSVSWLQRGDRPARPRGRSACCRKFASELSSAAQLPFRVRPTIPCDRRVAQVSTSRRRSSCGVVGLRAGRSGR
jgi:hypothetical protein